MCQRQTCLVKLTLSGLVDRANWVRESNALFDFVDDLLQQVLMFVKTNRAAVVLVGAKLRVAVYQVQEF